MGTTDGQAALSGRHGIDHGWPGRRPPEQVCLRDVPVQRCNQLAFCKPWRDATIAAGHSPRLTHSLPVLLSPSTHNSPFSP